MAPTVLWELGADVVPVAVEPDGFNINEECGATNPATLQTQVVAHGADIGVLGYGSTREQAFEQAALAMMAVSFDLPSLQAEERVVVSCEDGAPDDEILLLDWLNAVIFAASTRCMAFSRFAVQIDEGRRLDASAWGERIDLERHHPAVEVKGATMTALAVRYRGDIWVAQCVVDV